MLRSLLKNCPQNGASVHPARYQDLAVRMQNGGTTVKNEQAGFSRSAVDSMLRLSQIAGPLSIRQGRVCPLFNFLDRAWTGP